MVTKFIMLRFRNGLALSKNLNIFQGDMTDIQEILPSELKSIKDASDNCVKFAEEVKDKFGETMELTGKLLEISQHATGSHQEELAKAGSYVVRKYIFYMSMNIFTAWKRICGKLTFPQASVCLQGLGTSYASWDR